MDNFSLGIQTEYSFMVNGVVYLGRVKCFLKDSLLEQVTRISNFRGSDHNITDTINTPTVFNIHIKSQIYYVIFFL